MYYVFDTLLYQSMYKYIPIGLTFADRSNEFKVLRTSVPPYVHMSRIHFYQSWSLVFFKLFCENKRDQK